jgi:2-keto-4-pentenoate hydratase/2-oxohepta-3-ene-1,7-dioic acid hydratase in catechol pathway
VKFARLGARGHENPALLGDDGWYDLRPVTSDIDGDFLSGDGADRARTELHYGHLPRIDDADALRVGPPVARPGKIVCIGLNYRGHAAETNAGIPSEPVVFLKDPSTVIGPYDEILIPRGSTKTDWEVELGVVIGRTARYLGSPDDALGHVAGYVVSHDVSEREFQLERGGQWDKGKSCETFNPLGPWLVTPDEVPDPQSPGLRLDVNGVRRQDGRTADMIFPVGHVVWYLSQFMILYPGDLINTGTPAGVALGRPDHPYLKAGDVVELTIDGLGSARQEVEPA